MLFVENVSVSFGERTVLQNISLNIGDGEKVGLVGNNGVGKTTLLKVIVGEQLPDKGTVRFINNGSQRDYSYVPQYLSIESTYSKVDILSYMLDGRNLREIDARTKEIEIIMETPGLIPSESLLNEHCELQERYIACEGYRSENDILELLCGVGLDDIDPFQLLETLSGGQKSRVALARMLYEQSDLLILDEPTNHIDETAYSWLCQYLSQTSRSVLVISHLPQVLNKVVGKILYLDEVEKVIRSYPGNYSKFTRLRLAELKRQGRERDSITAEIDRLERFIQNAPQSKIGMKHDREKQVSRLKAKLPPKGQQKKLAFNFQVAKPLHGFAFQARNLNKSYGTKIVLQDVSLDLGPNEKLLLQGENGAGKTTLLRILSGLVAADSGTLKRSCNLSVGFYQQEQEGLNDQSSVIADARLSCPGIADRRLRSALANFLFFQDQIDQKVGTLSRGERARLAMCKIMLSGANCLLLDEPTNHLDPKSREILKNALAIYQGSLILVSHDRDFTENLNFNRVVVVFGGHLHG